MEYLTHYGPSLCVKLQGNLVYAGYGPFLHVYDLETGELINRCRIFRRNKIHGIAVNGEGALLLFGARSISIIGSKDASGCPDMSQDEKLLDEWIMSGQFSQTGDQTYLLTSYNKVLIRDLEGNVLATKGIDGEKSILYSGSITVFGPDKVLINAGTVMGGVLIWDLYEEKLLHNLKGHEGSIFYVTISENGRYVASCSDDRSVRLWDLTTGDPLSVGWGHTARIWNLKFYDNSSKLVSVSEDCTCRVWKIVEDEESQASLEQKGVYEAHLTKNIWGVDVDSCGRKAITSGNDGRLKVIELDHPRIDNDEQSYTLQEIADQTGIIADKDEIIKGFHWFDFGLVAITSQGKIVLFESFNDTWTFLFTDDQFASYSSTHGISSDNVVVFANNKSDLLALKFDKDGKHVIAKTKMHVSDLTKTNNCMIRKESPTTFLVLLESPNPRENLVCMRFNLSTLEMEKTFSLKKPESFVSSCLEVYQHFLLVGSRFSTLAVFDLKKVECPAYLISKMTPGDTTTSIQFVEDLGDSQVFSVTNRDGYYTFIKIYLKGASRGDGKDYEIIQSNKIVRGFLEGAQFNAHGDYITHGFKSSLFYIYNETSCYEITSHICGGAHRQWKLCEDDKGSILVYIKASTLFFKRFNNSKTPETLCAGIHGREIRDITIRKQKKYKDGYLFCTGSEDTTIKLMHVNEQSGKMTNYWTQRKHVSGLQRCQFIKENLMISSSAREELFLWELNTEGDSRPYIALRQSLPVSSNLPDLRIMDFDVKFLGASQNFILATVYSDSTIKVWLYDSEQNTFTTIINGDYKTCCILNVFLTPICDQLFLAIAPTDGHLIFYNITEHIPFEIDEKSGELIDNDLDLSLMDLPDYDCRLEVHQSGIKCMSHVLEQGNELFIYTGGDDNALGITIAKLDAATGKLNARVLDFQPQAAASTMTSCSLISNGTKLLTTSVDQIVRLWDITENKLIKHSSEYTTIADTGCSDAVQTKDTRHLALIGGVGLSALRIDL